MSYADCRKSSDNSHVIIAKDALDQLEKIGLNRDGILAGMVETSVPESKGCWAGSAGDFDGQKVSVGIAQWNFGQGTLQPLLKKYKQSYSNNELFEFEVTKVMPTYWRNIFDKGCLNSKVTKQCSDFLKLQQSGKGKLNEAFKSEIDALFESETMIQLQADEYIRLLGSVKDSLKRLFPDAAPVGIQIKWAIDTKIQQGKFAGDEDIKRIRNKWISSSVEGKKRTLLGTIKWYEGLCETLDQDGIKYDVDYNVKAWSALVNKNVVSETQSDLILLSFLRSRVSDGKGGLYQADTFQRRLKIILGVGSVHGRRE